jgi:alkylation response protein AidB-like acyl-CoA dehydrogenase
MDFALSEERRMLTDTLTRFVRDEYPINVRHAAAAMDGGFDPAMWTRFAELGAIGALIPPEAGGFGGDGEDLLVMFESLGRGLVVEPFLSTGVLGAGALLDAGHDDLIEAIIEGTAQIALAHTEADSRYEMTRVSCAVSDGKITGEKTVVLNGGTADWFVISARSSGEADDAAGLSLWLVDAKDPGVSVRSYATVDGGAAANVDFDCATGRELPGGYDRLENVIARGVVALCAEALGAMEVCKAVTLEYLQTRKQFGASLGKFQALAHRFVQVCIAIEQARSITMLAADALSSDRQTRERAVSAAKHLTSRVARQVSEETIQMHGGIAMTWEYSAAHFAKRLTMIEHTLGDEDFHLARFLKLGV